MAEDIGDGGWVSENEIPRRGEFHSLTCMHRENRVEGAGAPRVYVCITAPP